MKVRLIVSFLFLAYAPFVAAKPNFSVIDEYFNALKGLPLDLRSHGPVCEQMARYQMAKTYGTSTYDYKVGIIYWNDSRVVGELDLVVLRKSDNEALFVGEVKCQRRMTRARHHAESQLDRFADHIDRNQVKEMYLSDDESERFSPSSFDEQPEQWTIGQKGAKAAGFTHELELDLDDVLHLQRRLIRCQEQGQCS
jgi:hypothetical protein